MTVYRPVWKIILTTIDGVPTTAITLDYSQTDNGNTTVLESATRVDGGVAVFWRERDLKSFPEAYASLLAKKFDIDFTASGASTTPPSSIVSTTPTPQSRTSASLGSPTASPPQIPCPQTPG
jgi:hypothetical protein